MPFRAIGLRHRVTGEVSCYDRLPFMQRGPDRPDRDGVTQLLIESTQGNATASEELQTVVYEELRRLAGAFMRRERRDHTLQPTALVHEAYARLINQRSLDWRNRTQFLGLASVMMRRVLVNHARERLAAKRGGTAQRVSLTSVEDASPGPDVSVLALHSALEKLAAIDPRKSQIVELKFFGGLTIKEIGQQLQLSSATIEREWTFARAWLFEALVGNGAPARP
jgi:RNA polymerase sigma factor (TIGR02999 family)